MDDIQKQLIDNMDYQTMLRRWRHAPCGDPMFQGELGEYFSSVMQYKRSQMEHSECVRISKVIGWQQ